MTLANVELDPDVGDAPDVFDRPLPKDVRVSVHRVAAAKD